MFGLLTWWRKRRQARNERLNAIAFTRGYDYAKGVLARHSGTGRIHLECSINTACITDSYTQFDEGIKAALKEAQCTN